MRVLTDPTRLENSAVRVAGTLAGIIAHLGISADESRTSAEEVEKGGFYLGIDLARTALDRETVQGVVDQYGSRKAN